MTDYTALKTQLRAAMIDAGVQPPDIIKTDGAIQRFPTNDTLSDDAGWCIVFTQPIFGAHFGDWRTGAEHTWHAGRDTLTPAEHEALRAKFAETQQRQETAKRRRHAAARKEVEKIWAACKPAPSTHPYLVAKGVKSHGGVRVDAKGRLVIPLRDSDGVLHSLQYISAAPTGDDGGSYGKRFHPGGRKQGCFCMVGGGKREKICIAEGLATALSIHEATGYPVAAACDAGNLRPVAEALRAKHRGATLVLCADDDYLNARRAHRARVHRERYAGSHRSRRDVGLPRRT